MRILCACRFFVKQEAHFHQSTADPSDISLFRNLFFPSLEEISEYERLLHDDIYTALMGAIGIPGKERGAFKPLFLTFLYNRAVSRYKTRIRWEDETFYKDKVEEPVRKAMITLFPSIVFFFDLCKCKPGTLDRKGDDYKWFSHAVQSIESQIMLECCTNLWKKHPKMFLTTLHDSIKCLPKDVPRVEAELTRTFAKYHIAPKFEVEHHGIPSDANDL